jgi:ubiquinol-cytochrome c reductase cytochrome c1 subunit
MKKRYKGNIMRELKILAVVVFFSLVTYWGVEPFAHSQMHKHVESGNFEYKNMPKPVAGDATKGKELVMANCIACHSITSQGSVAPMDAVTASQTYGVNPPDLSNAGTIYAPNYLAAFIADPAKASNVAHKFPEGSGKAHPMPGYGYMPAEDIASIVAYLQSIAKKELTPKEVFVDACGRCHAARYDNKVMGEKWTQIGQKPKFKYEKESLAYDIQVLDYQDNLRKYMGKLPPDLSMILRARSENFLETFIENPQVQLEGTAMPAVGLTKESYSKVIQHLENIGDPSKPERDALGIWFVLYAVIFTIFAVLWKKSVWKKLH